MDTDPAQLEGAAENVELSIEDAAHAFKVHLGQADEPKRDERGRFASDAEQEIEAEAEAPEGAEDDAERHGDDAGEEEAAEEAQPSDTPLPTTWSEDKAEMWAGLPPEAQAYIAERDGQIKAASERKFEEAANVRKQAEAIATEASQSRNHALGVLEQIKNQLLIPEPDPREYGAGTGQYDRESYDLAMLQYRENANLYVGIEQQQQAIAAQHAQAERQQELANVASFNNVYAPRFVEEVPDLKDPAKQGPILTELMQYALQAGAPAHIFEDAATVSAFEFHMLWKAQEYDKAKAAKAKVRETPKPEPRRPQPVVRAGVPAPRVAADQARLKGSMDRLSKSGSVADGAAVFKQLLKGSIR